MSNICAVHCIRQEQFSNAKCKPWILLISLIMQAEIALAQQEVPIG